MHRNILRCLLYSLGRMHYKKLTPKILSELQSLLSDKQFSTSESDLTAHAKDKSFHKPQFPEVVLWPKNADEVSKILKRANKYCIPVTAWGGGSSTEGNPIP